MQTSQQSGLTPSEIKMFEEISHILEKYKGSTRQFGIQLLHSHFKLKSDEVLHEENNQKSRYLIIRPLKFGKLPSGSYPTAWNFNKKGLLQVSQLCCGGGGEGGEGGGGFGGE